MPETIIMLHVNYTSIKKKKASSASNSSQASGKDRLTKSLTKNGLSKRFNFLISGNTD